MKRLIWLRLKKMGIVTERENVTKTRIIVTSLVLILLAIAAISFVDKKTTVNFYDPIVISIPVEEIDMNPLEVSATPKGLEIAAYCDPAE